MEAAVINPSIVPELSLKKMMDAFFKANTPDSAREFFWKVFQCWVTRDCNIKAEISDEEVALFFDQLTDLVAAAFIVHQENRALQTRQKGTEHE